MEDYYRNIDAQIRTHYAQLAFERAMQLDMQERWSNAVLNKTETEILDVYKMFWYTQPEFQQIYENMDKELVENQNDYYEDLEYWRPHIHW